MINMSVAATTSSAPAVEAQPPAIAPQLEALLVCADRPVAPERLAASLKLIRLAPDENPEDSDRKPSGKPSTPAAIKQACAQVENAVTHLNAEYERTGRAFRIEQVSGGYRLMTLPVFAEAIAEFHRSRLPNKLSRAAVETLAIIAYKQPITRAQLEAIRGVSCGEVLKSLMERRIITIKGRAEELGRPMLYGTTKQFLDMFGLASVTDLPTLAELKPVP